MEKRVETIAVYEQKELKTVFHLCSGENKFA